ncbi:hypothetical protein BMS3Abin17_00799 [archaeon BMS3Abin17]|nr:hypothetical protein BMS3Abin17_00799 [archaeon BMS3Abin17]HDZ61482.1 putative toxin-antitoxin system toxin component, PIN family [Candidatus Pacearchaeota archaeon]
MKVVLDTNVWLSSIFWKGEASKIIRNCKRKSIQIMITDQILSEIIDVLNKEAKFQRFIKDRNQNIEDLIRTILSIAILKKSKTKLNIIKEDPKDNIILEAALDGKADYIISYDKHLLNMLEFRKIKIIKPNEFLKLINK